MGRIVYLAFPTREITGGQKTTLRHVETLRQLGFDAAYWTNAECPVPTWVAHSAPVLVGEPFREDDILVLPEDAPNAIGTVASMPNRSVIFCQNHFYLASLSMEAIEKCPVGKPVVFIACSRTVAACISRTYPDAVVEIVPPFVSDRTFYNRDQRRDLVAYMPRKRRLEARVIQNLFKRSYRELASLPWLALEGLSEKALSEHLGRASLFLSLPRFEALGLAALEAMLSGCVVAGFRGVGGREYATEETGFWVEDDDCEAAVDALARAAALVRQGGLPLQRHLDASRSMAENWSYRSFREALSVVWSRLAPGARLPERR